MYNKYEHFLESKNIGILYHFTGLANFFLIQYYNYLQTNRVLDSFPELVKSYNLESKKFDYYYISFTRNKNFYRTNQQMIDNFMSVRITIDGEKLSNKYKIYKANYDFKHDSKEAEECVIVKYKLNNINNYILKVEIPTLKKFLEEFDYNYSYIDNYLESTIEEVCNILNLKDLYEKLVNYLEDDLVDEKILSDLLTELYDTIVSTIEYDDILN